MTRIFRYRYVDFGTTFAGDPHSRGSQNGDETSATLFANALATDVGGTCWGPNEPLPIIDHHFQKEAQFPSASAAVLHKASQIRDRFSGMDLVWLVTHKEPDFDAFCSMYLARWIIEDPGAAIDWRQYGLHPEGWAEGTDFRKIDWFNVDFGSVPAEHRWALLLASYASMIASRRRISCPPRRALGSVLYAALKRGRDYLNATSGATEFFDEVRSVLLQQQLNPIFDSVLERSPLFAPELTMLDREAVAYARDLQRARRSTVYLPESEAPSPDFFKTRAIGSRDLPISSEVGGEHLLLADTFRIPTDGIYLRDPECLLFKEWARLDVENSSLATGFEFTAIAFSGGRPGAPSNKTDYQFSIDPERTNGRHLYTVWSRLQTHEVEALRVREQNTVAIEVASHLGAAPRSTTLESLLSGPWFGGQSQFGNAVSTPHRGTFIGPAGTRSDLRDDPVVEAVRAELENSIYSAASVISSPQVSVSDLAPCRENVDIAPQRYDLNSPLDIPAPPEGYFRFASIGLRADVPVAKPNLALQIGETLWQVLYPDLPGAVPLDFSQVNLIATSGYVGVWGERGIAFAHKVSPSAGVSERQAAELRTDFALIVSLLRDIDQLSARWARINDTGSTYTISPAPLGKTGETEELKSIRSSAETLVQRSADIRYSLALPDRDLYRRFYEGIGADQVTATLHEVIRSVSEPLRQQELARQAQKMDSGANAFAEVQSKLKWLQVVVLGILAVSLIDVITARAAVGRRVENAIVFLGGPLLMGFAAFVLKPWQRKKSFHSFSDTPNWLFPIAALAFLLAWLASVTRVWIK